MKSLLHVLWLAPCAAVLAQGPLEPAGAPDALMRTTLQLEPRIPITHAGYTITQPGSYYLTTNLAATGLGIGITCGNVTVDLMGFTLSGDGGIGDYGIATLGGPGSAPRNVTVRNGIVRQFAFGVLFQNTADGRIERMTAVSNSLAGLAVAGSGEPARGNVVAHCIASDNAIAGIVLSAGASDCLDNRIMDCVAQGNATNGILIQGTSHDCANNLIARCCVQANGKQGILFLGAGSSGRCNANLVSECIMAGNGGSGIEVSGDMGHCQGNRIQACTISGNGGLGVDIYADSGGRCEGNVVADCSISGNNSIGVRIYGSDGRSEGNRVEDCALNGNSRYALYCAGTNTLGNRLEGNHAAGTIPAAPGGTTYGIVSSATRADTILGNSCAGQTINYQFSADNTWGPVVTNSGILASSGAAAHPWANFSR